MYSKKNPYFFKDTDPWYIQIKNPVEINSLHKDTSTKPTKTSITSIFLELQKTVFFLSGQALTPPPLLVAGALKKDRYFFCGFPKYYVPGAQTTSSMSANVL